MKILLIDHDDSFIYNIKAWLHQSPIELTIVNYHQLHDQFDYNLYQGLILSPGPKAPTDYPRSLDLLEKSKLPILGVCLGFQMMISLNGACITPYAPVLHGKTSELIWEEEVVKNFSFFNEKIKDKIKEKINETKVARYHSLGIDKKTVLKSGDLKEHILAYSPDQLAMIYFQNHKPRLGLQFHPESFLTENGEWWAKLVTNWFQSHQHQEVKRIEND